MVSTAGVPFIWQQTFARALESLRLAALRYAGAITLQYTHRMLTNLTAGVDDEARERFPTLVVIPPSGGAPSLHTGFEQALAAARATATRVRQASGAAPGGGGGGAQATPPPTQPPTQGRAPGT